MTIDDLWSQPVEDIVGSAEEPNTHIFRFSNTGIIARRVYIKANKPGTPLNILQLSDIHLTNLNLRDFEEKKPSILSTYDGRRSSFNREDVFRNLARLMPLTLLFDRTVVTGDVIDYLTWGAVEYIQRYIYDCEPEALLIPGGHDVTRVVQGKVPDLSSLKSRQEILQTVWKTDLYYHSEIIDNRFMLVLINNGEHRYYSHQTERLLTDIEKARRENLVIAIFQHEPICTRNDKETAVVPLRVSQSPQAKNYCNGQIFIGNTETTDEESMELYTAIVENADVIRAVFCGHMHNEVYTEILGRDSSSGERLERMIPQYILDAAAYDNGHLIAITIC